MRNPRSLALRIFFFLTRILLIAFEANNLLVIGLDPIEKTIKTINFFFAI